jgi:hypothetical protein
VSLVDPIDEDEMGNPELVEGAKGGGRQGRSGGIGIDHDDRDIRYGKRSSAIRGEAD